MDNYLEIAQKAAQAGGAVIRHYYEKGVEIHHKESHNLVSAADLESEDIVVAEIRQHCPEHCFLGEETHKDQVGSEPIWIIDPLDGTNNFAHRVPHFACSVALYAENNFQVGAVYNPISKELFSAQLGKGAWHNGNKAGVSNVSSLREALVGTGFYYDRGQMMEDTLACIRNLFAENIHGIRRFGTASLDLSFVGTGRFDGFFEFELHPWDFAAGALFVKEAGGIVSRLDGSPLQPQASALIAGNPQIHAAVLKITQKHRRAH